MARQPKPQPPPLAATLRAALASDWRTLAALDTLTAARGSDARRLVHEALRALRGEGAVLEERVGRGGVEVRLLTLPAPVPDDGSGAWEPALICSTCGEAHEADDRHGGPFAPHLRQSSTGGEGEPVDYNATDAAADLQAGVAAMLSGGRPIWEVILDGPQKGEQEGAAPAPPVDQAAPVEAVGGPLAPQPGPSSRCAVCGERYHGHGSEEQRGHPFTPKPRGRPRVAPVAAVASEAAAQPSTAAEPETSRGGSEDRDDASTTDDARQRERERLSGPSPRVDGQPAVPGEATDQAPPMARTPRAKRTAAPVHRVDVSGCRPPLCHADDIHEPSRLRAFARPLCEAHRRWVEGAGGTLAAGGLIGVAPAR